MGVARFWGGIDHAYSAGYWYDRMTRGEPEGHPWPLLASMAYGMSARHILQCGGDLHQGGRISPLPHNYSNLEQLRLVRNMLLTEVGDKLMIGGAIPRPWLAAGKHVAFDDAMTTFGIVSARYETAADGAEITAKLKMPQMPARDKGGSRVPPSRGRCCPGRKSKAPQWSTRKDSITLSKVGTSVTLVSEYGK